jgi:hypothetical protein
VRIVTERFENISPEHVKTLNPSHIFLSGQSHPWDRYSREDLAGVFMSFITRRSRYSECAVDNSKLPWRMERPSI